MEALSITGLCKSFGANLVINDISFDVPMGSIFGFIGANGAGKTTTMNMALGFLESDSGQIFICGERVAYGKTAKSVGYLPDVPEFYNYMRPKEYLKLCGELSGMSATKIKKRGSELLEIVGLEGINRKIGGFSRGMKQRLGIAQALLGDPNLLICDEPTSALDPIGRKEILDILTAVKTTVIFSTHILSDVERICDHAAILHNGKIALYGTLADLKKRKTDSYAVEFASAQEAADFSDILMKVKEGGKVGVTENTVIFNDANGGELLAILAEQKLVPVKFELLEPTLESLYLEVAA
ncbi:MAG: ABC transporter ATP-binding protein [Defluviitaleaceae bacterium]|nr:ABC transporter ATP-binding protein [Defluviitaleaceae bacterium]